MGFKCILKQLIFCCFPSSRKWNEVVDTAKDPLIKATDNIKKYNKEFQKIEEEARKNGCILSLQLQENYLNVANGELWKIDDKVQKDALNVLKEQENHMEKMNRELWKMEEQAHKDVTKALKNVGGF